MSHRDQYALLLVPTPIRSKPFANSLCTTGETEFRALYLPCECTPIGTIALEPDGCTDPLPEAVLDDAPSRALPAPSHNLGKLAFSQVLLGVCPYCLLAVARDAHHLVRLSQELARIATNEGAAPTLDSKQVVMLSANIGLD